MTAVIDKAFNSYLYLQKYNKNNVEVDLTAERVTDLDEATKTWLMELITKNMKKLYEESDWGWKESSKKYVFNCIQTCLNNLTFC